MSILTLDDIVAAAKQEAQITKTASRTTVANIWFSVFDQAGNPGAGALAVGNTAAGIVPTDAVSGYPRINAFDAGAKGYLNRVDFGSSVACRLRLYDCLFSAGAFAFNAAVSLTSQPSYAGRVPGGSFVDTEIWVEQVTAATGNQAVSVNYTDQDGNAGATTGAVGVGAAPIAGRMWQLPLAAGDTGVQKIESVTGSVASAGTFNVHVMRRLWTGRVRVANDGDSHDFLKTGLPEIFADSALRLLVAADSTSSGLPDVYAEIVNK